MRGILLTLLIAGILPMALKRPWIGALLFAWVSIMNPHKLTFGFAFNFPFAQVIAVVTLIGFLIATKERKRFPWSGATAIYIVFMVWMTITSVTALGSPEWVWGRWAFVVKIHLMIFVTMMVMRGRKHIEYLVWVVAGSVAFYGVKGGLFTLLTRGRSRVWGPPGGMIEDNNALAVALVMATPLLLYLMYTTQKRWLKWALAGGSLMMALSILGSQSRGALLALLTSATLLGIKSKHPVRASVGIAVLVLIGVAFMPDTWTNRMDTIQNYQADTSAVSRIYSWITHYNIAIDRPLVGAGFGTETQNIFSRYAPTDPKYAIFTKTVWAAHSIYLQVLGEHGFVGLAIFLLLMVMVWLKAGSVIRRTRNNPEYSDWAPLLMRMCQVSLVGYLVGGLFLSLAHVDVIYYILAMVFITDATVKEAATARAKADQVMPAPLSVAPPSPRRRDPVPRPPSPA